jgi:hypothetical protein
VTKKKKKKYKRVPRRKRDTATLVRLRAEFGELPPTEMLDRIQNRGPGPRKKWDAFSLSEIFLCVEALKAERVNPTEAWRRAAEFHGLKVNVVSKAWAAGRDCFADLFDGHESEILSRFLANRPRLRERLKIPPKPR